jgi:hypothetical protein
MLQTSRLRHIRRRSAAKDDAAVAVTMEVHRADQHARHTRVTVEDLVLDPRGDRQSVSGQLFADRKVRPAKKEVFVSPEWVFIDLNSAGDASSRKMKEEGGHPVKL